MDSCRSRSLMRQTNELMRFKSTRPHTALGTSTTHARALAVLLVATFLGFGCTVGGAPKGTIEIGYIGAGSHGGDYSGPGLPNQAGAAFAVARAGSVRGFTLKF